jgi:hypothetical protein
MCEPVSIGFAVASLALSAYSMSEQTKATNKQAETNMANAKNAQITDTQALKTQADQIAEKGQDQQLQRQREALRERSRMRVQSGDMNGNSVDRLFNTSYFNENYDTASIENNTENGLVQNYNELEKVNTTALGRYKNAESQWVSGSQGMSRMAISGIQGGLQGYAMGSTFAKK